MASNSMEKSVKLMVTTSLTQQEIADIVGVRRETVSKYQNHPEFDELKMKYEREFLGDLVSPALRTLRKLLNSENDNVRLNAAKDILDRTGHKPIDKQEVAHSGDMHIKQSPYDELSVDELKELLNHAED